MSTKICKKCKIEKKSEYFYFRKDQNRLNSQCKDCKKSQAKRYYLQNNENYKKYYQNNKIEILKSKKIFYKNNQPRLLKKAKDYNKIHKKQTALYKKNREKHDIRFRLSGVLRTKIYLSLKGFNKSLSTMMLIGCEIDYLMYHLQELFEKGMTWDNYGKWHVDHIKPCSLFDMTKEENQRKCFHYSNLQPLWAIDNIKKSNKYKEQNV